jgi:plastocyanin/DNA-binding beta-propeller fold protein YncE
MDTRGGETRGDERQHLPRRQASLLAAAILAGLSFVAGAALVSAVRAFGEVRQAAELVDGTADAASTVGEEPAPAAPIEADAITPPLGIAAAPRAPGAGNLVGRVALQGRTQHDDVTLLIDGTPRASSDAAGDFSIEGLPEGKHELQARAPGYLCNQVPVRVSNEAGAYARGLFLTGGDAVANDEVDLFDLVVVAADYGHEPATDARADLNGDGVVNLFDLVMVSGNYGRRCPMDRAALAPEVPGAPSVTPEPSPTASPTLPPSATVAPSATPGGPAPTDPPTPASGPTPAARATARPDGAAVVPSDAALIRIHEHGFAPHTVYAAPAAWLTWRNDDDTAHEVTIPDAAVAQRLEPGEHLNWRPPAPGIYTYHCAIHRGMEGVIVVPEDEATAARWFGGDSIQDYYRSGCSSCHGVSREGSIGPALVPGRLSDEDRAYVAIIRDGRPGTSMPAWGRGGLSNEEIWGLVGFLRSNAQAEALSWEIDQIEASLRVLSDESTLPNEPLHEANLDALMLVTERESRSIAVIDGETHELVGRIGASYRAHGYAFDPTNDRWAFNVGRDGWVSRVDLYTLRATRQVRVGLDSRGVAVSDDGRTLIVGNYIPTNAVVLDAKTLLPRKIIPTEGIDPDGNLVASRVCTTNDVAPDLVGPYFLLALKEAGQMWRVDWSDPDYPVDKLADVGRDLHDGFLDPTNRYFYIASTGDDHIAVVDVADWSLVGYLETGDAPHPGSGAVWQADGRSFGATVHAGEGLVTIWDLDTHAIVGTVPTSGAGLFLRSAHNSPYVWADAMFAVEPHEITVFEKAPPFDIVGRITDGEQTLHPEFTADGSHVYVSDWLGDAVRVYDAETLALVRTIEGIRAPTGIFSASRRGERLGH